MSGRSLWRRLALSLAVLLCCAAAPVEAKLVDLGLVDSRHAAPRRVIVWVPDDYDRTRDRLPVIYMHDGQNLFDPATAYGGSEWGVDEALVGMGRRAIVVGVWNTPLRGREYLPAGIVARLPEPARTRIEALHGGPSLADGYLRFLVEELKPQIDRRFRTRTGPRHTAIMGSSMGGLISLYALGEYPAVFGQAAALSVHWPLADPRTAAPDEPALIARAVADWLAASRARPGRNLLWLDHGTLNLDSFYRPYSREIEALLPAIGWPRDRAWSHRIYEGTDHNEAAWRARVDQPLHLLLDRRWPPLVTRPQ